MFRESLHTEVIVSASCQVVLLHEVVQFALGIVRSILRWKLCCNLLRLSVVNDDLSSSVLRLFVSCLEITRRAEFDRNGINGKVWRFASVCKRIPVTFTECGIEIKFLLGAFLQFGDITIRELFFEELVHNVLLLIRNTRSITIDDIRQRPLRNLITAKGLFFLGSL